MNKTIKLLYICIAIICFAGVLFFAVNGNFNGLQDSILERKAEYISNLDDLDLEEYWLEEVRSRGGVNAYIEFKKVEVYLYDGDEHKRAHSFGGALFRQEGMDSFTVCDDEFHYGCFHEFIGRAIAEYGNAITVKLSETCISELGDKAVLCQHGIGHGVLSRLGYRIDNLNEVLSICRSTDNGKQSDPFRGCEGGAYMEFNMRTMLDEVDEVRVSEDILFPCTSLPHTFQEGCIFWQPQWWQETFMRNHTERMYEKMGQYCKRFTSDRNLLQACFAGIGNFGSGGVDYDLEKTASLCDEASAGDIEDSLYCRLRGFKKAPLFKKETQNQNNICLGLEGSGKEYCEGFISGSVGNEFTTTEGDIIIMSETLYFK